MVEWNEMISNNRILTKNRKNKGRVTTTEIPPWYMYGQQYNCWGAGSGRETWFKSGFMSPLPSPLILIVHGIHNYLPCIRLTLTQGFP